MHTDKTERDAFGYATAPFRVEYRPTYGPHTREELTQILDMLADCGVQAWWYSVATKGAFPLFSSRHLHSRDDAVDYLPWLVEEGHRRGISMFSWEYLSTAPLTAHAHPEWRWRFFDWEAPGSERDRMYVCYNSPYGDLLKDYTCEIVGDLGFDGVWFDGSFLYGNGATAEYACCCDWCAAKYARETGESMPGTVDFRDPAFRRFVQWRYDDHTEYWRALSAYVRRRHPNKIIVFNHFNRWHRGPECGSPLRRMAGDAPEGPNRERRAPMEGMIASERGAFPQQVALQVKTLRAMNDNYPPEVWMHGGNCASHSGPPFRFENQLFHAETCATHGGFASFGYGGERFHAAAPEFQAFREHLDPIAPYVGGAPVTPVGMLVSGTTKDFSAFVDNGRLSDPNPFWQSAHGMDNLLNALHVPSAVLFDNMLSRKFLDRFEAVVLPGVACMDDQAVPALTAWVRDGGLLIAVGETGTRTALGEPRDQGALDDLLGITDRLTEPVCPALTFTPAFLGTDFAPWDGYHEAVLDRSGHASATAAGSKAAGPLLAVTDETTVLATGEHHPHKGKRWTSQGLARPDLSKNISGAVMTMRPVGDGLAVCVSLDIARHYAGGGPNGLARDLLARLLARRVCLPFRTDAPPNVTITFWRRESHAVLHLLNTPPDLLRLPGGQHVAPPTAPEDFAPTAPIRIDIPGRWKGGFCPRHPERLTVETNPTGAVVTLNRLDRHAVIGLEEG
ncbi:MAG: hypothetical protein ACOC8F_01690 [Planctomycetota bacterium]